MTKAFVRISGILLSLIVIHFIIPSHALAYECANISVEPTSGTPSDTFTVLATNCAPSSGDILGQGYFELIVTDPDGNETPFPAQLLATTTVEAQIGGLTQNGTYTLSLKYLEGQNYIQEESVGSVTIQIEGGEDEAPNADTTLACGTPCTWEGISGNCEYCPDFCLAEQLVLESKPYWRCGSGPLCQNTQFDVAGVDSAIGCIPISNADATTTFLVQWALGIGGGIGLFLIAVSGIKIATTKGDPKRMQDARDTLTAAVSGLVLIVLSIFLIRFLTETLLQLF